MRIPRPDDIERLHDLAEEVIGELPIAVLEVSFVDRELLFTLEHITDGEYGVILPWWVMDLRDVDLKTVLDTSVEQLLDVLWDRTDGPIS